MNAKKNGTETAGAVIGQQDAGAEADTFADVFVLKTEQKTYTVAKQGETYSGYEGQSSGTKALFRNATREEAVGYAKEWVVIYYDSITETDGDEDFINEVFRDDVAIEEYVELPQIIYNDKGLTYDSRKIRINLGRMAHAYFNRNIKTVSSSYIDEGEQRPERMGWGREYIWGHLWAKKIREKLPLGHREMTLTLKELSEMRKEYEEIERKQNEIKKKAIQDRADRTLKNIAKEMPEQISWEINDDSVVVRAKKGEIRIGLKNDNDGIDIYPSTAKERILEITEYLEKEREKVKRDFLKALNEAIEMCQEEPPATEDDFELDFYEGQTVIKTLRFNGNEYEWGKYRDITARDICDILGKKDRYTQIKNILELTRKIGERKKAIEIAEKSGLTAQVKNHQEYMEYYEKLKKVYEAGYTDETDYDSEDWDWMYIEDYADTIPTECLTAYQEAKEKGVFDTFEIWTDADDPLLIGKVQVGEKRAFFVICRW